MIFPPTAEIIEIDRSKYAPPPEAKPAEEHCSLADLVQKVVEQRKNETDDADVLMYDLGSGGTPHDGFTGLDLNPPPGSPVIVCDLFAPTWHLTSSASVPPIAESCVDVYFSSHFVEHVPDWNAFFAEAWRTLKPGGYMVITTPYGNSNRAWQDSTHKQIITEERYWYLSKAWREANASAWQLGEVDFDILAFYPVWNPRFANLGDAQKAYHREHTYNAILDLTVVIRARK